MQIGFEYSSVQFSSFPFIFKITGFYRPVKPSLKLDWSALGKLMFERRAKVLTFFGRIPTMTCVQYS